MPIQTGRDLATQIFSFQWHLTLIFFSVFQIFGTILAIWCAYPVKFLSVDGFICFWKLKILVALPNRVQSVWALRKQRGFWQHGIQPEVNLALVDDVVKTHTVKPENSGFYRTSGFEKTVSLKKIIIQRYYKLFYSKLGSCNDSRFYEFYIRNLAK